PVGTRIRDRAVRGFRGTGSRAGLRQPRHAAGRPLRAGLADPVGAGPGHRVPRVPDRGDVRAARRRGLVAAQAEHLHVPRRAQVQARGGAHAVRRIHPAAVRGPAARLAAAARTGRDGAPVRRPVAGRRDLRAAAVDGAGREHPRRLGGRPAAGSGQPPPRADRGAGQGQPLEGGGRGVDRLRYGWTADMSEAQASWFRAIDALARSRRQARVWLDRCDAEVPALWPLISTAAEAEIEIVPGDGLLDVLPGPPRRVGLTAWSPDERDVVVTAAAEIRPDGDAGEEDDDEGERPLPG